MEESDKNEGETEKKSARLWIVGGCVKSQTFLETDLATAIKTLYFKSQPRNSSSRNGS